jgi:hypothetical protein
MTRRRTLGKEQSRLQERKENERASPPEKAGRKEAKALR